MLDNNYNLELKRILKVSGISLLLGFTMVNTYFPSIMINLVGLVLTSFIIYYFTLRRHDTFVFVMVMYFCSLFPFINPKGGGFNWVAFLAIAIYFIVNKRLPGDLKVKDKGLKVFLFLFILSSILGWLFNYPGTMVDLPYTIISFFGIVLLFYTSAKLSITSSRIKTFLKLNLIIIAYSTFLSINKYVKIITINTFLTPIYGDIEGSYFEGGGIIGSSPLYGEHSLILSILFLVFLLFLPAHRLFRSRTLLISGVTLSLISVFMSISRSVLLLTSLGFIIVLFSQSKIISTNITKQFTQIFAVIFLSLIIVVLINVTGLTYVFDRLDTLEYENKRSGGVTLDRILDGSAFNRQAALAEGIKKYKSRDSWLIGYGWNIGENQRVAFFKYTSILRGSAHSQILAILFLFGWIGFIGYFGILFRLIFKSYKAVSFAHSNMSNRLFALFSMIAFLLFFINEIKADSASIPSYFAATFVLMGLGYSNLNTMKTNRNFR